MRIDDFRFYGLLLISGITLLVIGIALPIATAYQHYYPLLGIPEYSDWIFPCLNQGIVLGVLGAILIVVSQILYREYHIRPTEKEVTPTARTRKSSIAIALGVIGFLLVLPVTWFYLRFENTSSTVYYGPMVSKAPAFNWFVAYAFQLFIIGIMGFILFGSAILLMYKFEVNAKPSLWRLAEKIMFITSFFLMLFSWFTSFSPAALMENLRSFAWELSIVATITGIVGFLSYGERTKRK